MNSVAQKEDRVDQVDQSNGVYAAPRVNVVETKDEFVLEAEMPGVNKDGLEILLENEELTIVGRRSRADRGAAVYRESTGYDYRRVFAIDPSIDAERISANMDQGVLTLRLPKAEKVKPRKINIG